jgi:hypothetical protein
MVHTVHISEIKSQHNFIGHMALKREALFIFLVATYILIYNTAWIEQYSFYLNYGVKLLVITSLFIFFRYQKMSDNQTTVVFLYSMLLMYGLLIATLNQQFTLSFPVTLKYGLRILALIAILMVLNTNRYSDGVVKFPIFIGVILSIQSILLFIMITSGNAPEPDYINIRGGIRNYGIWGFCPSIQWGYNNLYVPRVSSFFSEPSNFAIFLEYPIILSLGYYKIYGGKRYLFSLIVCLLCFILTFSWTGYFALFVGFLMFYMLKKKNIGRLVISIFMIALVYSFHMYSKEAYIDNPAERNVIQHILFSKYADALRSPEDIRGLYGGRVYSAIENTKLFFESPAGVGLLQNEDIDILNKYGEEPYTTIHVYGAFWFWLVKTGFVGMFIILLIFCITLKKIKTFLYDKTDIRNYISIAFISIAMHHFISGDWIDPMFLFVMALILAYKRRNYGGKCITARQLHV